MVRAEEAGFGRDAEGVLALRCRIVETGEELWRAVGADPGGAALPAPRAFGRFDILELASQAHAVLTGEELPPIACRLIGD